MRGKSTYARSRAPEAMRRMGFSGMGRNSKYGPRGGWVFPGMGRNSKYGPRGGWVFPGMGRNSKYGQHKNAGAASIETPAHTCRFAQPYSSRGCSPAEPRYASGCGAKVGIIYQTAKPFAEFLVRQDTETGKENSGKCCIIGKISVNLQRPVCHLARRQENCLQGMNGRKTCAASTNVKVFHKRQAFQDKRAADDKVFSTIRTNMTSNSV